MKIKKKQTIVLGMVLTMILITSIPSAINYCKIIQDSQDLGDSLKTSAWNPSFNYTIFENITYSWIEINITGTEFTDYHYDPDDGCNSTSFADQGWTFNFFGTEYDYLNVSTNGWMTFTNDNDPTVYDFSGSIAFSPFDIPQNCSDTDLGNYNDTVFLLGTDLYPLGAGKIFYQFFGAAPNRSLVIEYYQVQEIKTADPLTMEAIFYENGDIHFQYKSIPENSDNWDYPDAKVGLDHGDLINYNVYTNNWTQKFNNQIVAEKSVYFKFPELPPGGGGGGGPIPGADITLISLSALIAIVIIVRKFKKSNI